MMSAAATIAILALAVVNGVRGGVLPTKSRGLASIPGFCAGEEALDDLRDLSEDSYKKISGRYGSVSFINGRIINPPLPPLNNLTNALTF